MEIDNNILEKFIRGEATPQERAQVITWAQSSQSNRELFSKMKAEHTFGNLPNRTAGEDVHKAISRGISHNHQNSTTSQQTHTTEQQTHTTEQQTHTTEQQSHTTEQQTHTTEQQSHSQNPPQPQIHPKSQQDRPTSQNHRIFDFIIKAAAILLIPVSIIAAIQYFGNPLTNKQATTTIHTVPTQTQMQLSYYVNPGVKGYVLLPDSSQVWLNSGSRLDCPPQFDSTFRMVEVSGEAYFKVRSNKEWPLYIKTSKGITVEVTGTEFNLSSYENDSDFRFTLVSGNVTLIRESTNQTIAVNPLEEIIIPDNTRLRGKRALANLDLNTSWKEGYLVFSNTQMGEVIKKMERWYGVSFTVRDQQLLDYNFTANFRSESITQVLELLKITSNIGYIINDKNVTLFLK